MKTIVATEKAPKAIGPYSQAVKANGFLFVSGQVPFHPVSGEVVSGGIVGQTYQALNNLKAILEHEGMTFGNIVKSTVYLADMNDFAEVNKVYSEFFVSEPPARACVQVARLPRDVGIEIEVIAAY